MASRNTSADKELQRAWADKGAGVMRGDVTWERDLRSNEKNLGKNVDG
jgi:hypothetical protein